MALAFSVIAAVALFFAGCDRGEGANASAEEPEMRADSPSVYMSDPVFTNALAKQRAERREILATNEKLIRQLEAKVEAMRRKLPGASDDAIRIELEKDPEWNSLAKRIKDAQVAFKENRQTTTKLVGERIRPRPVNR